MAVLYSYLPGITPDINMLHAAAVFGLELFHDLDRKCRGREQHVHSADQLLHVGLVADQVANSIGEVLNITGRIYILGKRIAPCV